MKINRACKVCGKEFVISPSRIKYGRGITCSRRCQYILISKRDSKVKRICKYCNKEFFRYPSHINTKIGKGEYCSTKCAYANKKRGELAANWKGGKLTENEKIRKSPEYIKWIKEILKRDNYTCQICGVKGVPFHVHHIKEFAKYPKLRMNKINGTTLCIPCHSKIHNKILRRIRND